MTFYLKNTKEDIIMTKEDKEDFENNNICRFCEKEIIDNKVRDHCHLTAAYRRPARSKYNINVKQAQSNFLSVRKHVFLPCDCHHLLKTLGDI